MTHAAFTDHLLPDGVGLDEARSSLAALLRLEAGAARSVDRTFYDTFDGRLRAAGLRLIAEDGRIGLLDGSSEGEFAAVSRRPRRMLSADLPAGRLRDRVAPIVDMRALTPIARIRSRRQPLRVLDGEGKTVVRLVLEEPALVGAGGSRAQLEPRLHIVGVRGYDAALQRVTRSVESELGFRPAPRPLLDAAVTASGGVLRGGSSRVGPLLTPDQRADAAATVLLVDLVGTMQENLPGLLADIDSEFLHDYRVAVRRTRSAQRQLRRVFPPEPLARFRAEFRWLQQVTGRARDLDVYLLELDVLGASLPELHHPDLEPLRCFLVERRTREYRRMVRALRSSRATSLLAEWSVFLEGLVERPEADRPDAARPIATVAGARIGAVYRRIVKVGLVIDDASPPETLHELRKSGKELRYLLEFFAGLYPAEVVKPMVKTLKGLQDTLGRFQDREVQADMLRALRDEIAVVADGPAALMAMGLLVSRLEADQAAARSEFAERFAAFAAKPQRRLVRETFT